MFIECGEEKRGCGMGNGNDGWYGLSLLFPFVF